MTLLDCEIIPLSIQRWCRGLVYSYPKKSTVCTMKLTGSEYLCTRQPPPSSNLTCVPIELVKSPGKNEPSDGPSKRSELFSRHTCTRQPRSNVSYLTWHNLLSVDQDEFWPNASLHTNQVCDQEYFASIIDAKQAVDIDLLNTFNVVNHKLLLAILYAFHISWTNWQIVTSFLRNHYPRVLIWDCFCTRMPDWSWVLQCSVVGPLMFWSILMTDLLPLGWGTICSWIVYNFFFFQGGSNLCKPFYQIYLNWHMIHPN